MAQLFVYRSPKTMSDAHGEFEIFVYFINGDCLPVLADERTAVLDLLPFCRDHLKLPGDTWLARIKIFHGDKRLDYCYNLSRMGVRVGDSCEIEVGTSMYSPSLPAPLHVMRPVSFICVHKARLASKPGRRSRYSIVTASKEAIQIIAHVFVYIYICIHKYVYIYVYRYVCACTQKQSQYNKICL